MPNDGLLARVNRHFVRPCPDSIERCVMADRAALVPSAAARTPLASLPVDLMGDPEDARAFAACPCSLRRDRQSPDWTHSQLAHYSCGQTTVETHHSGRLTGFCPLC